MFFSNEHLKWVGVGIVFCSKECEWVNASLYIYLWYIQHEKSMFFRFIRRLNNPMLSILTWHDEHVQTLIQWKNQIITKYRGETGAIFVTKTWPLKFYIYRVGKPWLQLLNHTVCWPCSLLAMVYMGKVRLTGGLPAPWCRLIIFHFHLSCKMQCSLGYRKR